MLDDREPGVLPYVIRVLARTRDARALQPLRDLRSRVDALGLETEYRGGTRGSRPSVEVLRREIELAIRLLEEQAAG